MASFFPRFTTCDLGTCLCCVKKSFAFSLTSSDSGDQTVITEFDQKNYFTFWLIFGLCPNLGLSISTSLGNNGLCWTVFARNRDTAVPAEGNGDLQTLICVLVARSRRCLTLSNLVAWQNWMAAYVCYTLWMRTLFRGWPIMVNDTHTRRRLSIGHSKRLEPKGETTYCEDRLTCAVQILLLMCEPDSTWGQRECVCVGCHKWPWTSDLGAGRGAAGKYSHHCSTRSCDARTADEVGTHRTCGQLRQL